MLLEKRSLQYTFLIFLLLLAFIPAASAESVNTYTFNVTPGVNTFNFNNSYNGSFVSTISGLFTPEIVDIQGPSASQNITFHSDVSRNDVLVNVTIQLMSGMNADFSNILFYKSGEYLPYYISSITETTADVVIRSNVTAGLNTIQMLYGGTVVGMSNESSVFLFYLNNPNGLTVFNETLFLGNFTNADWRIGVDTTTPTTGQYMASFSLFDVQSRSDVFIRMNSTGQLSFGTITGALQGAIVWPVVNGEFSNVTLNHSLSEGGVMFEYSLFDYTSWTERSQRHHLFREVPTFTQFRTGVTGSYTGIIYELRIYNSTNITNIQISPPPSTISTETISFSIPTDIFSSVQQTFNQSGSITINVHYTPYVTPITENNAEFSQGRIRLEYMSNPGNFQTTFQISDTSDFSHVIISGVISGGIISIRDPQLTSGAYYWRIMLPDGTFTEARQFIVTEPEESGYPLALLVVPFIFAAWPILSKRSNRNPAETFVAITMGTIACLTIAYMLMAGIIIGGITYNTMFLAFPMIPVCFYYLYMFLKNVIDNKEKVRKPIS